MMTDYLNVSFLLVLLAEKTGWLKKIWSRILVCGILFSAVFTFSAGLGGIILSSGIWFWALLKNGKNRLFAKLAVFSGVACAAIVFGSTLVSPDTNNSSGEFSIPFTQKLIEPSVRVLAWENALENFREFPYTGRGTGANAAYLKYQTVSGSNQILLDAHNMWLNILGQTGLFGLFAFLALVVYLTTRCRFYFDNFGERELIQLALSCAFVGAFLYQGLSGSFEDARHLWILFGMLVGIFTFSKNDISEASPKP
jgi:O-antigen ligase